MFVWARWWTTRGHDDVTNVGPEVDQNTYPIHLLLCQTRDSGGIQLIKSLQTLSHIACRAACFPCWWSNFPLLNSVTYELPLGKKSDRLWWSRRRRELMTTVVNIIGFFPVLRYRSLLKSKISLRFTIRLCFEFQTHGGLCIWYNKWAIQLRSLRGCWTMTQSK